MAAPPPSLSEDFNAAYTSANVGSNAAAFDSKLFENIKDQIRDGHREGTSELFAYALVAIMLCAQKRADAVAPLFHMAIKDLSPQETRNAFETFREAITVTYPFIGLPNCVPACFGIIGIVRELGYGPGEQRRRTDIQHPNTLEQGLEMRRQIYRGVGNPEVHYMMSNWFPDMAYCTNTFIFGYAVGGSLDFFTVQQSELLIVSAILATGATRQSRSHVKASIQLGNPAALLKTLVGAAEQVAGWNGQTLPGEVNVDELKAELYRNLAALGKEKDGAM
ncbi:hypothetical protein MKZ38_007183 [Zalerion maritima]|uniref:Carboxymuconolactone decarboxylase-like domain-containing protein n=1 Tax=Zalerion maritima TaxID=339359 RepID=A0AAD5WPY3_9PEZI|nr:hypothetical protein MKZ38_007183 [Zalerion maritima]